MPHYAAIAVSNNKIQFLPNQTYEEFSRVAAIDLSDNALICNCQVIIKTVGNISHYKNKKTPQLFLLYTAGDSLFFRLQ
jgi:hypothetical protein